MEKSAVLINVSGRVQGVGFRYFARQQATPRGIMGWVRNLPDGSVEIWAESPREVIDDFIVRIRRGPTFGHVDDLDVRWTEPTGSYSGFDIRF